MKTFTCAIGFLALVLVLQDFWVPAEGVRVKVIKVKKDKRQAQRGYTDVPLDEGPFEEIENSSPVSTDFGDTRALGSDNLNDPENTQVDYSNGYPNSQSTTSSSTGITSIDSGASSRRVEIEAEPLKTASATIDEQREESSEGNNSGAIPGDAGSDYPNYATIPQTSFSCKNQEWPGYYADTEARCQVFWICQKNRMDAFLCPNGTLFNQQVFVCDWWFNVDCNTAPDFYTRNQFIYAGPGVGIDGKKLPSRRTNGESQSNSNRIITTVSRPAGTNSNPLVDRSSHISTLKNVKISSVNNNIYQESASANNPVSTQRTTARTTTRTTTRPTTRTTPRPTTTTSRRPPPPPIPVRKNTGSKSALSFKESSNNRQKDNLKASGSLQKHSTTTKQLISSSANNDDTFARNPTNKYGPPSQGSSTTAKNSYGPPDREFNASPSKEPASTNKNSKYTEPDFTPPPLPRAQGSAATLTQKYGPPDSQSESINSEYGAPGFVPGQPQNYVDESRKSSTFVSSTAQPNSFSSLDRKTLVGFSGHGQRSNQFNNVNGQRENMYSSSFKNSVIEYPISPSQQKNKLRLLELASRKDTHMEYPHFHGQRSNAFSDSASSTSYTSINNKQTFIDHTAYTGKKNIFSTPVSTTQKHVFVAAPTSTTPRNYAPVSVSTTSRPYFSSESSVRPYISSASTSRPYVSESSARPYITSTGRPQQQFESTPRAYFTSTARPYIESTSRPYIESHASTPASSFTVPDGYAALHAGSYISIATSPSPPQFSKKILISAANSKSFSQTTAPNQITFTTSTPRYSTISPTNSPNRHAFSSSATPTVNPYFTTTAISSPYSQEPRYVSGNNNYIVSLAPTQQTFPATTSAGHRQNAFTGHHNRRHNSFSPSGFSNTINYPGGVSETSVRFNTGSSSTKRNIVDFSYTASPISSTSTPYPTNTERFSQVISTTSRPHLQSSQNSLGTTVRYVGTVTNKSTNQNQLIYVDPADQRPPVSTAPFGNRISGSARKRMTGAWQNYFNDN